jgi:hypothetical protein
MKMAGDNSETILMTATRKECGASIVIKNVLPFLALK